MPLTKIKTKRLIKNLKKLSEPNIGLKKQLEILESLEKDIKIKKLTVMEDFEKRETFYKESEEKLKQLQYDDIILEIKRNTGIWAEYKTELEKRKPYDCFKRKFNLDSDDLKNLNPQKVRDMIFKYFEIGGYRGSRAMVKYYTVYKAFEDLQWL